MTLQCCSVAVLQCCCGVVAKDTLSPGAVRSFARLLLCMGSSMYNEGLTWRTLERGGALSAERGVWRMERGVWTVRWVENGTCVAVWSGV